MFPRAHFHDGNFIHPVKRDLFAEYGSFEAVDMASTFRGSDDLVSDLKIVSQQTKVDNHCQNSLSASAPCLPLLPPVLGQEEKEDCCTGLIKELRKEYRSIIGSSRYNKIRSARKRPAQALKGHFALGNMYYPKALVQQWMIDAAICNGNKLRVEPYIPPINSSFTGGCLSKFSWPNSVNDQSESIQYLCHSGGFGQEEVAVTALTNFSDHHETLQVQSHSLTSVSGRIKQICSQRIADKVFIGVRCDTDTHILLGQHTENEKLQLSEFHHKHWKKMQPTCISLSEYIPGEALISTSKGNCFILDQSGDFVHTVKRHKPAFDNLEPWHHTHFGSHPRQVLLTECTSVALYDIRGRSVKENIFLLPHNSFHQLERITVAAPYKNNSCYYVLATQTSLVLADLRFPNHTVLKWSHNLPAAPAYLSIVDSVTSDLRERTRHHLSLNGSTEDVILLGTQEESEVHAFPLSLNQPPPVKTNLQWALSRPRDILGFGLASKLVEPLQIGKRLNSSLCGLTGIRLSNGDGFSAFSITAMGDIFYQTFKPGAPNSEKSWRHGPGSEYLKVPDWAREKCTQWTNECQQHKDDKVLKAVEVEAQADLKEKSVFKQRGNKVLYLDSSRISPRKELAHVLCWLCMHQLQDEESEGSSQSDQKCCACNFSIKDGRQISSLVLQDKVMQKTTEYQSTLGKTIWQSDLIPEDPYSQILLKLWEEEEPDLADLVQKREDVIKEAVEKNKQDRRQNEPEEDLDSETQDETQEETEVPQAESRDTEGVEDQTNTSNRTQSATHGLSDSIEPVQQLPETASVEKTSEENTPLSQGSQQQLNTIPVTPSLHRMNPPDVPVSPQGLPLPPGFTTPRRQRRLSGSSNASVSSVRSTGSAAQGFLATPKRLLQRSRHSSPCRTVPSTPVKGILSPASTPNRDSSFSQPFFSGLSLSQPSATRSSIKRKATPSSSSKKKHRMGF